MTMYKESGCVYLLERDPNEPQTVYVTDEDGKREIWHDHMFGGSGCDNWVIEAGGETFDLEFCRSV